MKIMIILFTYIYQWLCFVFFIISNLVASYNKFWNFENIFKIAETMKKIFIVEIIF